MSGLENNLKKGRGSIGKYGEGPGLNLSQEPIHSKPKIETPITNFDKTYIPIDEKKGVYIERGEPLEFIMQMTKEKEENKQEAKETISKVIEKEEEKREEVLKKSQEKEFDIEKEVLENATHYALEGMKNN